VLGAETEVLAAIAEGNADYERRFGHVYLVCASGRSAPELLDILRSRLGNDPDTEDRVTRTELVKINRIRLGRMLDGITR
jgi:2-oxo-4-hydroxy-4-carboxy-5-ureidoimidazoline decarboxylase